MLLSRGENQEEKSIFLADTAHFCFLFAVVELKESTAATVQLKVVLTEQTGPQEEQKANRYLFPPGDCAERAGRAAVICQYRFLSDFNLLWLLSSCPFAHTELPLSNCHGSLLLQYQTIFAWTGWIRLFLRSRFSSTKLTLAVREARAAVDLNKKQGEMKKMTKLEICFNS